MTLTTLEMDGYFTEKDIKHRYDAYIQCRNCKKWTYLKGTPETYGHLGANAQCEHCQSNNMDMRSLISYRTFNPLIHNKRKPT